MKRLVCLFLISTSSSVAAAELDVPRVADDRLEIVQFAAAPDIVHPVTMTFDANGRLLVIESHTHFRPADYKGPPHDRIRVLEDTDGDGRADKFTTFYEGSTATMDIATARDGSVYVASRSEIIRLFDKDGDGRADDKQQIVRLQTAGNYPHNGLSGLAFDDQGNLWFGMGENLGASYELIGSDGAKISDEGEGGNVFRCTLDGKNLRRIATGFWNPFGLTIDRFGRVWAVDNDPDSSPPCRLVHVVDGGDYGYAFRYGRSGRHPFQCWNGQLPGTLPMVAGTGESPCEVVSYNGGGLPSEYDGDLLITTWADHRVERYRLQPRGASYTAERKPFVQGGTEFRPVGLAVAPDGSLFISDWVRRDYQLHGQGAVWHLRPRNPSPLRVKAGPASDSEHVAYEAHAIETKIAAGKEFDLWMHDPEQRAPAPFRLAAVTGLKKAEQGGRVVSLLNDPDPFIRSAVVRQLGDHPPLLAAVDRNALKTPLQRIGLLLAERRAGRSSAANVATWLDDSNEDVRFMAVKWIADAKLAELRPRVVAMLDQENLSVRMYQALATALARIDGGEVSDAKMADMFVKALQDNVRPARQRVMLLRLIPASHKQLTVDLLTRLANHIDPALQLEAVRTLAEHPDPKRFAVLKVVAIDNARSEAIRGEALVGLAADPALDVVQMMQFAIGPNRLLRTEALRALVGANLTVAQQSALSQLANDDRDSADAVARILKEPFAAGRPDLKDTAAWLSFLSGEADADDGRRVFFHPKLAGCFRCHRVEGHGQNVGPDLSLINTTERRHMVESILQPSLTVAPHYQVWQMETADGQSLTGMLVHTQLDEYTYLDPKGATFKLRTTNIADVRPSPTSIMPNNLTELLTTEELRNLLAFLSNAR